MIDWMIIDLWRKLDGAKLIEFNEANTVNKP